MKIFTDNWDHLIWSPGRLDDGRDLHSDICKMIITDAQENRPRNVIPEAVRHCSEISEILENVTPDGETSLLGLMLRTRQGSLYIRAADRTVLVADIPFDSHQIWAVCVALLGYQGPVWWRIKKRAIGGVLLLGGLGWCAAVMSMRKGKGKGPQVLP